MAAFFISVSVLQENLVAWTPTYPPHQNKPKKRNMSQTGSRSINDLNTNEKIDDVICQCAEKR